MKQATQSNGIAPAKITSRALRAALIYAALASLWILLSDSAVEALAPSSQSAHWMQTVKGWAFVGVTATLLFFLLRASLARLVHSEERFRLLAEGARDCGIIFLDPEGRVVDWNPGAELLLGHAPGAILGHSAGCFHPQGEVGLSEELRLVAERGSIEREGWRVRADGSRLWANVITTALRRRGEVTGYAKLMRDLTERRRAEEERTRLAMAVEEASDCIALIGADGRVISVNRGFEELTGQLRTEVIGRPIEELRSELLGESLHAEIRARVARGEVWRGRLAHRGAGGSVRQIDGAITPLRSGSGGVAGFVCVLRDVTREVQLEDQLRQAQKLEAIGQLAGGVAHDFNNLLQAIQGFASLAATALPRDHEVQPDLQQVLAASARAAALTRQLLLFSRQQTLEAEPVEINALIENLRKMLRRLIGEHIALEFHPGEGLPPIQGDPGQLEQVIVNLVVNARDAMPAGGKITVETQGAQLDAEFLADHPWARPGPHLLITVSDTGEGMDRETLARIFEPFFTTKSPDRGTGLGLSTVYGIVKQHGGMIHAYSEPGHGTIFKVYFPQAEEGQAAGAREGEAHGAHGDGVTILLAEDEESVRRLTVRILNRAGHHVVEAGDGEEAIAAFERARGEIDLAILDVIMPGCSGREVCEAIRAQRPDLPVLFTSGYTATSLPVDLLQQGRCALLMKPADAQTLLRHIRELLAAHPGGPHRN